MDADYTAIPRQAWFDLCALAVKYATEEKAARNGRENAKGGEADSTGAYPATKS